MIRKASARDASELAWFKSSYSDSSNPSDCLEIATTPGTVHVRDSKKTQGPQLTVRAAAWTDFVSYASGR